MQMFSLPFESVTSLEALAEELEIYDFDLLLVGDGSGSVYDQPCGWVCAAYDRLKSEVTLHAAALSCGTNNFAELAPFVQALWFHHQVHGKQQASAVEAAIISDSEVTVRCGQREYSRNANGCLWSAVEWFEEHGYRLSWRHVRRCSNAWNSWADQNAGYMRQIMESQRHALLGGSACSSQQSYGG